MIKTAVFFFFLWLSIFLALDADARRALPDLVRAKIAEGLT